MIIPEVDPSDDKNLQIKDGEKVGFTSAMGLPVLISQSSDNFATDFKCTEYAYDALSRDMNNDVIVVKLDNELVVVGIFECLLNKLKEVTLLHKGIKPTVKTGMGNYGNWIEEV